MRSVNDIEPQNETQGFQFPGVFEITAVGKSNVGLEERMVAILTELGLEVLENSLNKRSSRAGKYVALTVNFACPSRDKYDAAHAALRADADIHWTL